MPLAAAVVGSAVVGAAGSMAASKSAAKGAKSAANTQAAQAASDREMQWDMYQQQREDFDRAYERGRGDLTAGFSQAEQTLQPYAANGVAATNRLAALAGVGGSGDQLAALSSDPGYNFRVNEGVKSLDRSAASRGLLLSGAQVKGVNDYTQGQASSELGNAFNRTAAVASNGQQAAGGLASLYQNRGTSLSNLATGQASQNAQLTQNTTNAVTQIGQNSANQISQAQMAGGQARASGYTGVANAANNAIGNGLFLYGMQNGYFGNTPAGGMR